jgi:hypothetical protein
MEEHTSLPLGIGGFQNTTTTDPSFPKWPKRIDVGPKNIRRMDASMSNCLRFANLIGFAVCIRPSNQPSQQANVHANAKNSKDGREQVLGACQRLRVLCAFVKVGATAVEIAKKLLQSLLANVS